MYQLTKGDMRGGCLLIGSIAAGFAFGWVAGVAAFFLFISISPNDYPRDYFQQVNKDS